MWLRPTILLCALAAAAPAGGQTPPAEGSNPGELESVAPTNPVADLRRGQQDAARANAAAALRDAVRSLEIGRGLRVGDVVDRTRSADALTRALAAAQPQGGPRWVDDQTCQVQLVVPGPVVADAVTAMLAQYPGGRPPVRPEIVAGRLAGWRRTAFSATGSSAAGGSALQQARPCQVGGVWAGVSDADRRATVAAAESDAVHRAADDFHRVADPLPLGRVHGAEVLARPAVERRVRAFLDAQPVTHLEFLDDRTVSLSMTVDAPGLARAVRQAVTDDQPRTAAAAAAAGDWDRFRRTLDRSVQTAVTGTAAAPAGGAAAAAAASNLAAVVLPIEPPGWVDGTLDAEGSAPAAPDRLRTAGLAEAAAVARLREKLLALHVGPTATLADATRADPLLAAGVSRVLSDAHEYHVRYAADGSVTVRVSLDLRQAWDQLRSNP